VSLVVAFCPIFTLAFSQKRGKRLGPHIDL
jgi:hypothetical protein